MESHPPKTRTTPRIPHRMTITRLPCLIPVVLKMQARFPADPRAATDPGESVHAGTRRTAELVARETQPLDPATAFLASPAHEPSIAIAGDAMSSGVHPPTTRSSQNCRDLPGDHFGHRAADRCVRPRAALSPTHTVLPPSPLPATT